MQQPRVAAMGREVLAAAVVAALAFAHLVRRGEPNALHGFGWRRFAPIVFAAAAAPFHSLAPLVAAVPAAHALEAIVLRRREPRALRSAMVDVAVAISAVIAAEIV